MSEVEENFDSTELVKKLVAKSDLDELFDGAALFLGEAIQRQTVRLAEAGPFIEEEKEKKVIKVYQETVELFLRVRTLEFSVSGEEESLHEHRQLHP